MFSLNGKGGIRTVGRPNFNYGRNEVFDCSGAVAALFCLGESLFDTYTHRQSNSAKILPYKTFWIL